MSREDELGGWSDMSTWCSVADRRGANDSDSSSMAGGEREDAGLCRPIVSSGCCLLPLFAPMACDHYHGAIDDRWEEVLLLVVHV